jgi:hypothetical protein
LYQHELFKFGTARAEFGVNFSNLDVRRHDHACSGTIRIEKRADKRKTSARKLCEGLVQRVIFRFTSRDGMITSVLGRFASKEGPTSLKLRHASCARAQFSEDFCAPDPATV